MMNLKNKGWIEITIPVTESSEELIANFLFELGSTGCSTEKGKLCAYFKVYDWDKEKSVRFQKYLDQLSQQGLPVNFNELEINLIEDQDWNEEWKKFYQPIQIAGKFIVKPGWIDLTPDSDKILIEIDPQMAFGTGTHETTQLVIELMLNYSHSPARILDIGTGTGILSIAAAKLFNARIFAFDIDPVAITTTKNNIIKNKVAKNIELFCSDHVTIKDNRFDLVLANINRSVIFEMLPSICEILTISGMAIFSGILIEEKIRFLDYLKNFPLRVVHEKRKDEWIGFVTAPET